MSESEKSQRQPTPAVAVSLVQLSSPDPESLADRRERASQLIHRSPGSELYVLPELWGPGYFSFDSYEECAELGDGSTVRWAANLAREMNATIHLGSLLERGPDRSIANLAMLLNPQGKPMLRYRKVHVFGHESREAALLSPGTELPVVDTLLGKTATTTCYDLRFPGLWAELRRRGAESVIVPAAWPHQRIEHWRTLLRARAIEGQMWIIACNASGSQRGIELGGHSMVIDPRGTIVAEAKGSQEEVITTPVHPSAAAAWRAEFDVAGDARSPSSYRDLGTRA